VSRGSKIVQSSAPQIWLKYYSVDLSEKRAY